MAQGGMGENRMPGGMATEKVRAPLHDCIEQDNGGFWVVLLGYGRN